MTTRSKSQISVRKEPRQARSTGLLAVVLEAAVQVLASEGAHRFTVARVAERAGVSVGSIYQYFPNKAAILFRLQQDEWRRTTDLLRSILEDQRQPPLDRLRALVHAFLASECEEAQMRQALGDAAPLYRDAPETRVERQAGSGIYRVFIDELLPQSSPTNRAVAAELIETTLSQVGKFYSSTARSQNELFVFSAAMADMLCAFLSGQTHAG